MASQAKQEEGVEVYDPYVTAERNLWTDPPPNWGKIMDDRTPREGGPDARGYGPGTKEIQEVLDVIVKIGKMRRGPGSGDLTYDEENEARFAFTSLCASPRSSTPGLVLRIHRPRPPTRTLTNSHADRALPPATSGRCNWTMNNDICHDLCIFPGLSEAIKPYARDSRYKAQVIGLLARLNNKEFQTQIQEDLWIPASERCL